MGVSNEPFPRGSRRLGIRDGRFQFNPIAPRCRANPPRPDERCDWTLTRRVEHNFAYSLRCARLASVIPPTPTRASKIEYDKYLYKERHKVENLPQRLKQYRRIATRLEKNVTLFGAMVTIASILIWLKLQIPDTPEAVFTN